VYLVGSDRISSDWMLSAAPQLGVARTVDARLRFQRSKKKKKRRATRIGLYTRSDSLQLRGERHPRSSFSRPASTPTITANNGRILKIEFDKLARVVQFLSTRPAPLANLDRAPCNDNQRSTRGKDDVKKKKKK